MRNNPQEEPLKFVAQDKGFLLYNFYLIRVVLLHDVYAMLPPVKRFLAPIVFSLIAYRSRIYGSLSFSKIGDTLQIEPTRTKLPTFGWDTGAGLLDRTYLLKEQIVLGFLEKRIPVISPLVLNLKHNRGNMVYESWSKYFDIEKITITTFDRKGNEIKKDRIKVVQEVDFIKRHFFEMFLGKVKVLNLRISRPEKKFVKEYLEEHNIDNGFSYRVKLSPSAQVLRLAEKVIRKLEDYSVLHVRRGDTLHSKKYEAMSLEFIKNKLHEKLPLHSRLYIMTDEQNKTFFDALRGEYEVYQYFDFPELEALVYGNYVDNYHLFVTEQVIASRAKIAISPVIKHGKYQNRPSRISLGVHGSEASLKG